jgi:hypothetical protein
MKRKIFALPILLLSLAVLFSACDKKTSQSASTEGAYDNEEFLLARADADTAVAELRYDDGEIGDWLLWSPGRGTPGIADYDSASGWHFRNWEYENDFIEVASSDSFRLTDINSDYQRHRDSTTNVFDRRIKKRLVYAPQSDSLRDNWLRTRERNMIWSGLADSVTTLNGDFHRRWIGEARRLNFTREIEGTLDNIKFYTRDLHDGRPSYPFDGVFEADMVLDVETEHREVFVEAHLAVTFYREGDQFCYHARLERGDNWWEWDRCFPE